MLWLVCHFLVSFRFIFISYTVKNIYSLVLRNAGQTCIEQTCIKWLPSILPSPFIVLEIVSLNSCKHRGAVYILFLAGVLNGHMTYGDNQISLE